MDLPSGGERITGAAIVRGSIRKTIIFTSIIPTDDACGFGGISWLMELDARNGNATSRAVFDLNGDGAPDSSDNGGADNETVYNGWSQTGIQSTPTIIAGDKMDYKVFSGSSAKLRAIGERPPLESSGRQSWRQIK